MTSRVIFLLTQHMRITSALTAASYANMPASQTGPCATILSGGGVVALYVADSVSKTVKYP